MMCPPFPCGIVKGCVLDMREDNEGCITVVNSPKFTPHTKHMSIKYHHFGQYVIDGTIILNCIDKSGQIADIFTKPL